MSADEWVDILAKHGYIVYKLEDNLFLSKKSYEYEHNIYYTTPVYHIFNSGIHETAMNVQEAYAIWERNKKALFK